MSKKEITLGGIEYVPYFCNDKSGWSTEITERKQQNKQEQQAAMRQLLPILSVTGSDSTGGAGIQGDIKTIASLGGYAVTVLTSVTVQSMHGIQSVFYLPAEIVAGQLRAVISDVVPKAVKIGMIGTKLEKLTLF